jgi:hypothetical protein
MSVSEDSEDQGVIEGDVLRSDVYSFSVERILGHISRL